jgi:hypothetical protein
MLTRETPMPVASREYDRYAPSHCGRYGGCQCLISSAQRTELVAAAPATCNDVRLQTNCRIETANRIDKVDLDRHEIDVGGVSKDVG